MEVALAVLVVLVVLLAGALIRSHRRTGRDDRLAGPAESAGRELELIGTASHGDVQATGPGSEGPREFILEDGSGRQLFAQLIEPSESALWRRADTMITHQSSSVALDKVLDAVPVIGVAVRGGKWVRILNPEAFGLGDQVKSKSGGFLGSIYGERNVVAQLRFSKPEDVAKLATPLAVFKVASMVTGQYYLNRINGQLMTIEGQVRQIRQELRNDLRRNHVGRGSLHGTGGRPVAVARPHRR